MKIVSLTLKGFRGIRDGMGRDVLVLDFDRLASSASLVAIAGANGRGKTTVMDNLHPFLTMPSRAPASGPGGFSYYEHVVLPESEKSLVWEMGGRRYRSQIVIRTGGRRRTEAYLFAWEGNEWRPASIADGTVSDGRCDSYSRCVEAICGSAETFFTSVFAAQGRRHLSQYRNAEIKGLLADLLGLDEIGRLGSQAQEVARGLKAGLGALRMRQSELSADEDRVKVELSKVHGADAGLDGALKACEAARIETDAARLAQARVQAEQVQAATSDEQRARLEDRLRLAAANLQRAEAAWQRQQTELRDRAERLNRRIDRRFAAAKQARVAVEARLHRCEELLAGATQVQHAERRLPLVRQVAAARSDRVEQARGCLDEAGRAVEAVGFLRQRLGVVEQTAGRAVLQAQELDRRFALTGAVPCSGLPMQGRCQLLSDARDAASLRPSAQREIERLAEERSLVLREIEPLERQAARKQMAAAALRAAQRRASRAANRESSFCALAGRAADLLRANADRAALLDELKVLQAVEGSGDLEDERVERRAIAAGREESGQQLDALRQAHRADAVSIEQLLAALPPRFDSRRLADAAERVAAAQRQQDESERAKTALLASLQACRAAEAELSRIHGRRAALDARSARVQARLADWLLFARCMSHDGLIALAIEDAGPALSGLANDLLLACYGARFSVAIRTQVETAKGEAREGFDIEVHDAESGESKSVVMMSGGERVWISCRDRHEIHYAENPDMPSPRSGRRLRPCNCAAGTCEAMRHNTAGSGTMSPDARGGKSLSLMSGGERTFIDASLTRAIALYLAQNTGRRFDTLFSDEADGPLDPEHKRMFMAMKREVLRLGGYQQEFFITQTPHLATMADAIIDFDAMQADAHSDVDLVAEEARR